MKKTLLLLGSSLIAVHSFGQSDVANPITGHFRQNNFFVGWQPSLIPGLSVPGTLDIRNAFPNQPILFQTGLNGGNAINRMKLNGSNTNYGLNGYPANAKDGYLLIGSGQQNVLNQPFNLYSPQSGAFSMLHLNGIGGVFNTVQDLGYRPWMQTGLTLTGNDDLSYFGLRTITNGMPNCCAVGCFHPTRKRH